jgi:transposase
MAPRDRNNPARSVSSEASYTAKDMEREFPDDKTCLDYLWRQNFSDDGERAHCPKCGQARKFHRVASRPSYSCDACGHHLHPTAGTIFHKSSTGLELWFRAIFLMSSTRCGISAKQLERELGVTYKTAWRMFHLIRQHLMDDDKGEPLDGSVEVVETWVAGNPRASQNLNKGDAQRWAFDHKTPVWGAVERGGRVVAKVVPNIGGLTVRGNVRKYVLPAATLYTDEYGAYSTLYREGYEHHAIQHRAKVYVAGDVHTQTIEGFWSTVKNGIRGAHHSVSRKHLQGYLNEYAWRYNHRDDTEPMFKSLLASACRPVDLAAS